MKTADNTFSVGDGATYRIYTDCEAGTIIDISKNGKFVTWQRDKATLLNGVNSGESDALTFSAGGFVGHTSGKQRYEYEANPKGEIIKFSLRKNGMWKPKGYPMKSPGCVLKPGRNEYYDFNF